VYWDRRHTHNSRHRINRRPIIEQR